MALNTIKDLINKKGEEYVNSLLDEEVIITEKLDTYRFLFEKQGDYVKFFKKNNAEINLIERTLTDIWEDAVSEIPMMLAEKEIPEGVTFGVAYTPVERPIRIPYYNLPKYILTDITERKNGKVVESYDYDTIEKYTKEFGLAKPPIIFQGKLTEKQKKTLLKYGKQEFDGEEDEFPQIVQRLFEGSYSQGDLIEGLIIRGHDGQLIKINSYEFDILNEAYERIHHNKDFYDLTILSLNKLLENYSIPVLEEKSKNERYIDLICDVFNKYCDENHVDEEFISEEYITPPSYGYLGNLNKQFITNERTLELLDQGAIYEALFKVVLSAFRKRKKPSGLLNESAVDKFNSYVYLIDSIINDYSENSGAIYEQFNTDNTNDELVDEEEISEGRSDNAVIGELNKNKYSDVDNMRVISSIQKAFDPKETEREQGNKYCGVYITNCKPFSAQNLENAKKIHQKWNVPVIIGTVSNNKMIEGEKFNFSDELKVSQLDVLNQFYSDFITNYLLIDTWSLEEVFEHCRPDFEPIVLVTDQLKKSEFAVQLYFEEEIMGKRLNVDSDFNIGEMEANDIIYAYRALEDSNAHDFQEYTPRAIWNLFNNMVSEYKTWSGQILK